MQLAECFGKFRKNVLLSSSGPSSILLGLLYGVGEGTTNVRSHFPSDTAHTPRSLCLPFGYCARIEVLTTIFCDVTPCIVLACTNVADKTRV